MSNPESEYERRSQKFNWSFKNGRDHPPKGWTFADVVNFIVEDVTHCPVFAEPCLLVPIPRSGSSRESFDPHAVAWPAEALARALASRTGHRFAQLLRRERPVGRSSDGLQGRVTVKDHLASMRVEVEAEHLEARIVLLDDMLTLGTQSMACLRALRLNGHLGPIEAYFVHQTVAPYPTPEQRARFLCHRITWADGERLAQRVETGRWRQ
ncbi:phosphoribosyltransferase [Nannocystis radixulma]|uniref:Phosphoribosyltransferase n=1 Tax=Nannocystis radixulma TaxID=2995305 RepID=A0ABT5B151_9BACT|nr:phosphoribosyltransferase [Nannocystis radixulma]MDC0667832.1 phosphoribosyltransferase [Nannocystis radixulma]